MKKSERLNQMLKFINQKKRFSLRDLMMEFHISKRTALRDIASMEELGAPIYAEHGRNGGYSVVNRMQLPPISFNSQEVYALYISLQILESVTNIPFKATYETIHRKFTEALTDQQKEQVQRIKNRIQFHLTRQLADYPFLDTIITAILENQGLEIIYRGEERSILPITVHLMKGFWYCQSYDLVKKSYRVFRCDRIERAQYSEIEPAQEHEHWADENFRSLWRASPNAVRFKALASPKGVEQFQAEHYPSMKLVVEQEQTYISGTYEPHEIDFIVKYLSSFGKELKVVEPDALKAQLKAYYLDLIEQL